MPINMKLTIEKFASVVVTTNSTWTFAVISDGEGNSTTVEITAGDNSRAVAGTLADLVSELQDEDIRGEAEAEGLLELSSDDLRRDNVLGTAVSGLRTAVTQLGAMRAGVGLTEFLGGEPVESVPLYANINRSLFATDRTPEDFYRVAERAAKAGFRAFKCAPFDEVRPPSTPGAILDEAAPGLARVAAVRDAIGPDATLLVDCHSRFERDTAPLIVDELHRLNVGWFEEPVQPTENAEILAEIARWAPMPVAGGESGYGVEFFDEILDSEAVSVIMPDVKHCGGVGEAVRSGRSAVGKGHGFSIHSPAGPISLLASGHATAATNGAMRLEHAVYEADWRADLVLPTERVEDGRLWFPGGVGLGATLNWDIVQRFGRVWEA